MSTSLYTYKNISATQYFGGEQKGVMLNIADSNTKHFVQLSARDCFNLRRALDTVVSMELERTGTFFTNHLRVSDNGG